MSRTTPEGKVKAAIRAWLREKGAFFFLPNAGPFGAAGIPDIVGCYRGRFFGIEVKAPGKLGNVTDRQREVGYAIHCAGGQWTAADNLATVRQWWEGWADE